MKDTSYALKKHQSFFDESISVVINIYSYGFSFSNVDIIYINKICSVIQTENSVWYLNDFDKISARNEFEEKIRKCGYKGKFDTFHIIC
ncbi:MAG: hypothetical protein HGA49_10725 [Eubacteriaceae bacterium]|nr:hypothetical protein [Eubacteriaceae bacterium]